MTKTEALNMCDNCGKHPVEMKDFRDNDYGGVDKIYSCRWCSALNTRWHDRVREKGLDPKKVLEDN